MFAVCAGVIAGGATCSLSNVEQQAGTLATNTINNSGSTVTAGFYSALVALGKQNPTDSKLASNALSLAASNCLATFSGTVLPLSSDAQAVINGLGGKLPASATGIATMLTGAITAFVQIPSASTRVSTATATTVCNLCNEIIAACNQYNAAVAAGTAQ
jgi:hypothetical protein